MPFRDFRKIHQDLTDVVSRLKKVRDSKQRICLLRELRVLIEEADTIIAENC